MPRREGENIPGRMETAGWKSVALPPPGSRGKQRRTAPIDRVPTSPRHRWEHGSLSSPDLPCVSSLSSLPCLVYVPTFPKTFEKVPIKSVMRETSFLEYYQHHNFGAQGKESPKF